MSNHPLARANAPPCARCSGMRGKSPYVTTFPDCIKDTAAKADVCTLVGWLGNLRESANKDLFESLSLHFFWTKKQNNSTHGDRGALLPLLATQLPHGATWFILQMVTTTDQKFI